MKQYSFLPPINEPNQQRNWRVLIEGNKYREYDPTGGISMATLGWTNAGVPRAVYVTNGPICYYTIWLSGSGGTLSWLRGATLLLPFTAATRGDPSSAVAIYPVPDVPFQLQDAGTPLDYFRYTKGTYTTPAYPALSAVVGASGGGALAGPHVLKGWYFI